MRIDFKPQSLMNRLVLEEVSKDGNSVHRLIEIPKKNAVPAKVLDITYQKSKLMPTEWFVSNYNVINRDNASTLSKTMSRTELDNGSYTVVKKMYTPQIGVEKEIAILNGQVFKSKTTI